MVLLELCEGSRMSWGVTFVIRKSVRPRHGLSPRRPLLLKYLHPSRDCVAILSFLCFSDLKTFEQSTHRPMFNDGLHLLSTFQRHLRTAFHQQCRDLPQQTRLCQRTGSDRCTASCIPAFEFPRKSPPGGRELFTSLHRTHALGVPASDVLLTFTHRFFSATSTLSADRPTTSTANSSLL